MLKKILVALLTVAMLSLTVSPAYAGHYWSGRYNTANVSERVTDHVKVFGHITYRSGTTKPKGRGRAIVQVSSVRYSYRDNRDHDECNTFEGENYFYFRSDFESGTGVYWRPGGLRVVCENIGQNTVTKSYHFKDSPVLKYGADGTVPHARTYWSMHNTGCCDKNGFMHAKLWWLGIHTPLSIHSQMAHSGS